MTTTLYAAAVDAAKTRTSWVCSRCEKDALGYPAQSRHDLTLAVCPPCGNAEAIAEFLGRDPWEVAYGMTRDQIRVALRALARAGDLSPAWKDMDPVDVFRQHVEANALTDDEVDEIRQSARAWTR